MKKIIRTSVLPYLLYTPEVTDKGVLYPLIIFLHGVGQRGNDPLLIEKYCLPRYIGLGLNLKAFIYAPQCPPGKRWENITSEFIAGLEKILSEYPIDKQQISITGFSMGAGGVWNSVVHIPDLFCKIIPVAGRIPQQKDFFNLLPLIKDKAIWIFHSEDDKDVDVSNSQKIIAELKNLGAANLRYTIFDTLSHGETADKVYSDSVLYDWILKSEQGNCPENRNLVK